MTDEQKEFVEFIIRYSKLSKLHTLCLIDFIKYIFYEGEGFFHFQPLNLEKVVKIVKSDIKQLPGNCVIQSEIPATLPDVKADLPALVRLFTYLLCFPPVKEVLYDSILRISAKQDEHSRVSVNILIQHDTKFQTYFKNVFYHGSPPGVAKLIAQRLGGDLLLHSSPERTHFQFSLPIWNNDSDMTDSP